MQSCRNNSENTGKFYPFKLVPKVFLEAGDGNNKKKASVPAPGELIFWWMYCLVYTYYFPYHRVGINIYKRTSPKSPNSSQLPPWVQHGIGNGTEPTTGLGFYFGLFWAQSLIRYMALAKALGFSLHLSGTDVWSPIFLGMQLWCNTGSRQWKVAANSKMLLRFQ